MTGPFLQSLSEKELACSWLSRVWGQVSARLAWLGLLWIVLKTPSGWPWAAGSEDGRAEGPLCGGNCLGPGCFSPLGCGALLGCLARHPLGTEMQPLAYRTTRDWAWGFVIII